MNYKILLCCFEIKNIYICGKQKSLSLIPKFIFKFMDPCFFQKSNQDLSEQWKRMGNSRKEGRIGATATYRWGSWKPFSLLFRHQETVLSINLKAVRPRCWALWKLSSSNGEVEMGIMLYRVELERSVKFLEVSPYKSPQRNEASPKMPRS